MSKVVGGCRPLRLRPCVLRGGCKLSESAQVGPRGRVFDRSGPLLYMDDYMKNYDIPATYYFLIILRYFCYRGRCNSSRQVLKLLVHIDSD